MKIHFYGYNTFLIEIDDKLLAIDPGALFFYWFRFTSLIPKSKWQDITHIFITHGDPDHYWHADRVAQASKAKVICNQTMLQDVHGERLALGPRAKGLAFTTKFERLHTLSTDECIGLDGMTIRGVKATHGELVLNLGPFKKKVSPGARERIGWGALGYDITLNGTRILNLGDTLLNEKAWQCYQGADVLMIPIGGRVARNTMGEEEALKAVEILRPKLTIPCHYNCPGLFSRSLNPADQHRFKREVEALGLACSLMDPGDSIVV